MKDESLQNKFFLNEEESKFYYREGYKERLEKDLNESIRKLEELREKESKMKHIIKFKKLHPDAQIPVKAHETDACYDCFAVSMKDHGDGRVEYDMGFAIEMPKGGRVDFRPRSSIHKTGMILCNSVGTVDEHYRGGCKAFFYNIIKELPNYQPGDRICQMLFDLREDVEFVEVDELSNTDRGSGGFGSSGK